MGATPSPRKRGPKPVVLPPLGCGVAEHDSTCLCDVVIDKPVEIIGDAVDQMWMGRQLCDTRGYCAPWTDSKMLDYFTDLCTFHDRWHSMNTTAKEQGNPARQRLNELSISGIKPAVAVAMVYQEYGVQYSRAASSAVRIRWQKKYGDMPYDPTLE